MMDIDTTNRQYPERADPVAANGIFNDPPWRNAVGELQVETESGQPLRGHHDLSESSAEAASRLMIRTVPLVYGVLLGHLSDHLLVGTLIGGLASAALDLYMGEDSMIRRIAGLFNGRRR